uniref:Neuropeptide-Like Protein n=1 Tax=Strongyloides venezuelensis TaxID=75913 RepID=A0A0K0G3W3_STRVS
MVNMKLLAVFIFSIFFLSTVLCLEKEKRPRSTSFDRFYKRAFDSIDNGGFGGFDKRSRGDYYSGGYNDYDGSNLESLQNEYVMLHGKK